ncbi:MAG TPA: isoleucine--tRNA ligase, partial [Thermodesulfobacteriaceae bacterium]|nr:isoleucine--tRNA ligase [Thermodesulfobacteriaceae bacterium]
LMGYDAPYVPGWDCHGLPIEHNVEKELGPKRREMGILSVRKACRRYAEKFVKIQKKEFARLGVAGDWENPYLTMTYDYEAAICRQFCRIFLDGHITKSKKPVYWCPACVTALAEAEVEYAPHVSSSITVKFPAEDDLVDWLQEHFGPVSGNIFTLIWTTTPWTLPANLAVALHPDFDYVAAEVDVSGTVGGRAGAGGGRTGKEIWILAEGRLLATLTSAGLEQSDIRILGTFKGSEIEGMHVRHPFLDRDSLIISAAYVTLDAGTGCVHTAPGHGMDDYESGVRHGLEIYSPVDDNGCFSSDVKGFEGMNIFDANEGIIALLRERSLLVSGEPLEHSYPHCWRCKKPVIFRATPQWFISMEAGNLRTEALGAIKSVTWIPEWGRERIYGMVETRPDWCISRQRAWGVPLTVLICRDCEEPVMDRAIADRMIHVFESEGADAWFSRDAEDFLPSGSGCPKCGSTRVRKETDILDVWFDSGVSHAAVLDARQELGFPADLYLEGSDQHRGWFQSSLLTSVATKHTAPYRSVLTHGFVVDGQGKKMSKSVGNVIPPEKVIKRHGAEVLRLWASAEDYHDDIKISDEILQRQTEAYRKIRNTIRCLLSNLSDFDPEEHALPCSRLESLDTWILMRLGELNQKIRQAYTDFRFHVVSHQLQQFCIVDLSSLYLDIIKDRLYCELSQGRLRRSAQTAIYQIARHIMILMAPVLSFTAEEAWRHLPGSRTESVFLAGFPDVPELQVDQAFRDDWKLIWDVRGEITKALEVAREEKRIGLALDARVLVGLPETLCSRMEGKEELLKTVTIVSQLEFAGDMPLKKMEHLWNSEDIEGLTVSVERATGEKCARCWQWSDDVGESTRWPDACGRCVSVLDEIPEVPSD